MAAGAEPPREPELQGPFYAKDMERSEQELLNEAMAIEGLEQEIALLRVRLKAAFEEEKPDLRLLTKVMNTLVRAVATQYRISPKARQDLADNLSATLNSLGDQLLPADQA